uniref:Plasmolipin n=1 Tax=Varanus komodoensis TaxID=61221 RepID=A0A8D2IZK1_VARKO
MSEFPAKVNTRTSTPAGAPALRPPAPDLAFLRSPFGILMAAEILVVFNVAATVLYATAFITSAASVEPYSWPHSPDYNRRASASFFACLVMIGYGVSACLSIRAWRGYGSDAATSQATFSNHA